MHTLYHFAHRGQIILCDVGQRLVMRACVAY